MSTDNNNKNETNDTSTTTKRSESDVYDRQIRLWGADAQAKMSKAKVLYIHMTGGTSEVLKNLVLAGIRPAICDVRKVADNHDFLQQTPSFFWAGRLGEDHDDENEQSKDNDDNDNNKKKIKRSKHYDTIAELVQPAIEDLNPLLGDCELVNHAVQDLTADLLSSFSVIVASRLTPTQALSVASKLTPEQKLFWVDCFGFHGVCWVDLGPSHWYRPEQGKKLLDATQLKPHIALADMYKVPLHLAVNRFHKKLPPLSLVQHKMILAYCEHKQQWPAVNGTSAMDVDDFVQYIRTVWLPQTSPSLLESTDSGDMDDLFSETALQSLAKQATCEMVPVCSVVGGLVGNEIIKAISGKGAPANNVVLFDGTTCKGWFFLLQEGKAKK